MFDEGKKIIIYLAGPLFTQAERIWNIQLHDALISLDSGLSIYMPQREVEKAYDGNVLNFDKVFEICRDGIDECDAMVAILEGSDADSGTCWECGYAYARGKPIIGVRTDARASEDEGFNPMLRRSCVEIVVSNAIKEDRDPKLKDRPDIKIKSLAESIYNLVKKVLE